MTEPNDALNRLRRANVLPPGAPPDGDELAAVVAECEQRVDAQRGVAPHGRATEESLRPVAGPRPRWRPALVFSLAFAAVIAVVAMAALFSDSGGIVLEPDVANTAPPTTSGMIGNVAYVDDLVYYEAADRTLHTSVFYPLDSEGPFPVVVLYDIYRIGSQARELSRRIADRGAVVFAPIWVDAKSSDQTASEYLGGAMWDRAACAVGYAQENAESFGGDPARTTVMGNSGGEHPATWVALGLADMSDCGESMRFQPNGLIAGQSQWLFQELQFDEAFDSDDAIGVDTVDRFLSPEQWDPSEHLSVFLWTNGWAGNSAGIDDPPAEDSWIWARDPNSDLVDDLAEVDAFADGLITYADNTRLMHLRMTQASIEVSYQVSDDSGFSLGGDAFETAWQLIIGG